MPLVMGFFEILWFLLLIEVGLLTWLFSLRTQSVVTSGQLSAREWWGFRAGFVLVGLGLVLVFALEQFGRGANPVCLVTQPGPSPFTPVWRTAMAGLSLLALGWIWLAGGDRYLARLAPVLFDARRTYRPRRVRLVVSVALVLIAVPGENLPFQPPDSLVTACQSEPEGASDWAAWESVLRLRQRVL